MWTVRLKSSMSLLWAELADRWKMQSVAMDRELFHRLAEPCLSGVTRHSPFVKHNSVTQQQKLQTRVTFLNLSIHMADVVDSGARVNMHGRRRRIRNALTRKNVGVGVRLAELVRFRTHSFAVKYSPIFRLARESPLRVGKVRSVSSHPLRFKVDIFLRLGVHSHF